MTRWAFLENQSVNTITRPEARSIQVEAAAGLSRSPIMKASAELCVADQILKLSQAAIGTPTKFTKSLPANAKASEKVPARMMILKTLMRKKEMQIWKRIVKPTKSVSKIGYVLALIQSSHSARMKEAPLAPFMTRK